MEKLKELLFLQGLKGVGKISIQKKYIELIKATKDFDAFLAAFRESGSEHSEAEIEEAVRNVDETIREVEVREDISAITVFDENYPEALNVMKNKQPLVLYVKGNAKALHLAGIAVIGTREPSDWTLKVGSNLVNRIIQDSNLSIISGLAIGCDTVAHSTAINDKRTTVAVLPAGLENIYPAANKRLADDIIKFGGCLVTEYGIHSRPTKSTFVERDGVVAALSASTLVLECGIKSGTMHTVDFAESYGRIIACYKPTETDVHKGEYDGNAYMLEQKGAVGIATNDDVAALLKKIQNIGKTDGDGEQISLFDLNIGGELGGSR